LTSAKGERKGGKISVVGESETSSNISCRKRVKCRVFADLIEDVGFSLP
jgi:hypothetical protein